MKFYTLLFLFFAWWLHEPLSAQQYPIIPQIIVPQPVPTSAVQVLGQTGQPLLVLMNTDPLKNYKVMIGATIVGDNRIQGEVDPLQKRPQFPITLQPGGSITLSGDDILEIFSNYSVFDISYSGIDLEDLIQNQLFPEGIYQLCVRVYDYQSGQQLSSPNTGCSGPIKIRTPDPPIIIYPRERQRIDLTAWQTITFRWTPVLLPQAMPQYRFRLAEVPDGVNPYDAIDNDNLLRWEAEDLSAPLFLYDPSLPPLPEGTYAVQVTAYDALGQVAIKNEGRSDVVSFRINKVLPEAPALRVPYHRSVVHESTPQNYRFSWQPVRIEGTALHHDFRLVRLPYGRTPSGAMQDPTLLVDEVIGIESGTHYYSDLRPSLQIGETYAWQVHAYDVNGEIEVQNDGYSGIYTFTLAESLLPAPLITVPEEATTLTAAAPLSIDIAWEHNLPAAVDASYELSIWAYDGQSNPVTFARNNAPIWRTDGITGTNYRTNPDELELGDGGAYLVQVRAYDTESNRAFSNEGKSELRSFRLDRLSSSAQVLNLACGEGCSFDVPGGTTAVNHFISGDTLRLGNFLIRLTDASTRSGTFYSGEGEILPASFFHSPVLIRLQNLRFNADGIAIGGMAETIFRENLGLPAAWTTSLGGLRLPTDPEAALSTLENNSVSVTRESTNAAMLPLRFGEVYLTYLKLLPATANANLVHLRAFSGDRFANTKYALFGKKAVCFSAAGPAVAEEEAFLPLQNDLTVERSAAYSITLLRTAGGATYGGTALPFSCEGGDEINAAGYVSIRSASLSRNGQTLAEEPLYGAFQATFNDWFDWQTVLYLRPAGARASCCSNGAPQDLKLAEMPHYRLEVSELYLDHSAYSNPVGLNLPAGSNIADDGLLQQFPDLVNLWNGIQFRSAKWKLPPFLAQTNNQRISFGVQSFILDDKGFSGQTTFATDEFGIDCQIKDWAGKVRGVTIDIQRNELQSAAINFGAILPFFEEELPLLAENNWSGTRSSWQVKLDLQSNTDFRIASWGTDFNLVTRTSRIYPLMLGEGEQLYMNTALSGHLFFDDRIGSVLDVDLEAIGVNSLQLSNARSEFPGIPHVSIGSYTIPPSRILKIAGYRVSIDDLQVVDVVGDVGHPPGSLLRIDYHFNFDKLRSFGQAGIQGYSHLDVLIKPVGNPVSRYQQHSAQLYTAPIDWEPKDGVHAQGTVSYYGSGPNPGFRGQMELDLVEYQVRVNAQMGTVGGNSYWAFAGEVVPEEPIDLFCGLSAHSFGGGIYYNMRKPNSPDNGASVITVDFLPPLPGRNTGNYGFMFSTVLLDSETTGDVFNGRFLLEVDMRNNGLDQIRLSGMSYLLENNLPANYWVRNHVPSPEASFLVDANIRFDWPERRLEALAGYRINFEDGLLTGEGQEVVDILIDRHDWHIYLGQPGNRLNAQLNILDDPINLDAYFMIEGQTDQWSRALETVQVGMRGRFYARSNAYDVPVTVADQIKFSGWVNFDLEGGLGFNTSFCSNHPSGEFFSYLGAGLDLGFRVDYYESKDSVWPWLVVNNRWNRWERWFGWGFNVDMAFYTPSPTGIRLGVGVDIPYWGWEDFSINLGSSCQ